MIVIADWRDSRYQFARTRRLLDATTEAAARVEMEDVCPRSCRLLDGMDTLRLEFRARVNDDLQDAA